MSKTAVPAKSQAAQTPAAPAQQRQPLALKKVLEDSIDRLEQALPRHLTPERVIQVVTTLNYRTPDLQKCDPSSILACVVQASTMGLELNPTFGEGYLIPRWNRNLGGLECTFMPGYRGLVKLARQSGGVAYAKAELVREGDLFEFGFDPELRFRHAPSLGPDRGNITRVYAVAKLASGDHLIEVMTVDEVEVIHERSESYRTAQKKKEPERGPWVTDWAEMAKKTVLKRLCKSLPMSVELAGAVEADNAFHGDEGISVRVPRPGRGVAGLSSRLGLGHDETPLPPQPSALYSEADEPVAVEETTPAEKEDDGWEEGVNC